MSEVRSGQPEWLAHEGLPVTTAGVCQRRVRHIGAPGLAHGGAIAAACDDVLGFTLWIDGTPAVTRNLSIGYRAPVPLHQPHRIVAQIDARKGPTLHVSATGTGQDGVVRFTATARFIAVSVEHFAAHGDLSEFGDTIARSTQEDGLTTRPAQPKDDT